MMPLAGVLQGLVRGSAHSRAPNGWSSSRQLQPGAASVPTAGPAGLWFRNPHRQTRHAREINNLRKIVRQSYGLGPALQNCCQSPGRRRSTCGVGNSATR